MRTDRENKDKCAVDNCTNRREFYEPYKKILICQHCKLNYFSCSEVVKIEMLLFIKPYLNLILGTLKIVDSHECEVSINFVSKLLKAMKTHAKIYNIDFIHNGFSDLLHEYKMRLHNFSKRFKEAVESDQIEQYSIINSEVCDMKKELDLSELMNNFVNHRFKVSLGKNLAESSNTEVDKSIIKNDTYTTTKKFMFYLRIIS